MLLHRMDRQTEMETEREDAPVLPLLLFTSYSLYHTQIDFSIPVGTLHIDLHLFSGHLYSPPLTLYSYFKLNHFRTYRTLSLT